MSVRILYVDESGVEELGAGTSHFVLLGLCIQAHDWKPLDESLERIKEKYQLSRTEIHAGWMHRRYSEQESIPAFQRLSYDQRRSAVEEQIRRRSGVLGVGGNRQKIKKYRRETAAISPYIHLIRSERIDCLRDLATALARWNGVQLFAEAISKPDFIAGRSTPYEMAFEQVLTRYQSFLRRSESIGIVVHDNNTKVAPRLHELSLKFHQVGTLYKQISNVVETPLFVDSCFTSMIQMADLCAFSLRRFIENDEVELWETIEPCVDEVNSVKVGIRHYTAKRPCSCRICLAHGRSQRDQT